MGKSYRMVRNRQKQENTTSKQIFEASHAGVHVTDRHVSGNVSENPAIIQSGSGQFPVAGRAPDQVALRQSKGHIPSHVRRHRTSSPENSSPFQSFSLTTTTVSAVIHA